MVSSRTTRAGQGACRATYRLTEPSSRAEKEPAPREPTTSIEPLAAAPVRGLGGWPGQQVSFGCQPRLQFGGPPGRGGQRPFVRPDRPPRPRAEGIISRAWGFLGLISATLVMTGFFLALRHAGWHPGADTALGSPLHHAYLQATTVAWLGIVACQVGTAFAMRTDHASLRSVGIFTNGTCSAVSRSRWRSPPL